MTYVDLAGGHSDLICLHFETSIKNHCKIYRTEVILLQVKFVPIFNVAKVKFHNSTMTLTKGSRSNGGYVWKGLDKGVIHAYLFDPRYNSLWI